MRVVLVSVLFGLIFVGVAAAVDTSGVTSKDYVDVQANSVSVGKPVQTAPSDRVLLWVEE